MSYDNEEPEDMTEEEIEQEILDRENDIHDINKRLKCLYGELKDRSRGDIK